MFALFVVDGRGQRWFLGFEKRISDDIAWRIADRFAEVRTRGQRRKLLIWIGKRVSPFIIKRSPSSQGT